MFITTLQGVPLQIGYVLIIGIIPPLTVLPCSKIMVQNYGTLICDLKFYEANISKSTFRKIYKNYLIDFYKWVYLGWLFTTLPNLFPSTILVLFIFSYFVLICLWYRFTFLCNIIHSKGAKSYIRMAPRYWPWAINGFILIGIVINLNFILLS